MRVAEDMIWHTCCKDKSAMNLQIPAILQHPLAREIALAIVIKLVLISVLYFAFFDGRTVSTDPATVAERLIAPSHPPKH